MSHKLKTSGIRTQVLADINDMITAVSSSKLCGESSDGTMFLNMRLYNKIDKRDCVALDGGYALFIKQFEEFRINKGFERDDNNFFYPIRKEIGESLSAQELHFNKTFGSFRSIIENQFSEIHNKYKRFSNNSSTVKTDDFKYVNIQFKVACLLKNIQKFVDKFNIIIQPHHKLWEGKNFDFPTEKKLVDVVFTNEII